MSPASLFYSKFRPKNWSATQLGSGGTTDSPIPRAIAGGERGRFSVATTGSSDPRFQTNLANSASIHTCGRNASATYCWGANSFGQIGDGSTTNSPSPLYIGSYVSVAIGGWHTCGLTANGQAFCWGYNANGQLGAGPFSDIGESSRTPVSVAGELPFKDITAGLYHTCGLSPTGNVYCWGLNNYGQVGNDTTVSTNTPLQILDPATGAVQFSSVKAGSFYTCGLTTAGSVYCWGNNYFVNFQESRPKLVSGTLVVRSLAVGNYHACGIASDGRAFCWGFNGYGGLGDNTKTNRATWVEVLSGDVRFDTAEPNAIATGMDQTCAIADFGRLFCWGRNDVGQLGDGTTTDRLTPVPVRAPNPK